MRSPDQLKKRIIESQEKRLENQIIGAMIDNINYIIVETSEVSNSILGNVLEKYKVENDIETVGCYRISWD